MATEAGCSSPKTRPKVPVAQVFPAPADLSFFDGDQGDEGSLG